MIRPGSILKRVFTAVAGISLLVGLVLVYNGWLWLYEGVPNIPRLEGHWWAGYYDTSFLGRQWCVARFAKSPSGDLRMVMVSAWGAPDVYEVTRSTNGNVVDLTFTTSSSDIRLEAKQLYIGKRYYFERLLAGRFSDFWKMNDDVSIRGDEVSLSPPKEFALEPIKDEALDHFWRHYVRPNEGEPTPAEIIRDVGFEVGY